jgi:hypothetical protein
MTRVALFVLLFSAACAAHPGLERWGQRALLAESTFALACDYGQTSWMADGGKWDRGLHEADPLLMSPNPSGGMIAAAPITYEGAMIAGYETLPNKWRWALLIATAVVETANITTQPQGTQPRPICGGLL